MKRYAWFIWVALAVVGCGTSNDLLQAEKKNTDFFMALTKGQSFAEFKSKSMLETANGFLDLIAANPLDKSLAALSSDATSLKELSFKYKSLASDLKIELAKLRTTDNETLNSLETKRTTMVQRAEQLRSLLTKSAPIYQRFELRDVEELGMPKGGSSIYEEHVKLINELNVIR